MKRFMKFENISLENINLNSICRFCLSKEGILLSIFDFTGPREISSQIQNILKIEIEKGDGLPSLICHSCLFNIEQLSDFKNQCEKADSILRNYLKHLTTKEDGFTKSLTRDSACQADNWNVEEDKPALKATIKSVEVEATEECKAINDIATSEVSNADTVMGQVEEHRGNENDLQMEENMNELEEGMFGSEPFSLDLCSVRLQSEGQQVADTSAVPPLTDEEQWSDTGSDISEEMEVAETTAQVDSCHCSACNKGFSSPADLLRHQLIHKPEPPYPCDYCDKEFDEKMILKAHWRTHARNRPHMCLTCGEAFMERAELVKHFVIHDVIKPYHCSGCGKAFAYRSDLRKHAIIHTGARPFKCPVCGKTFTRSTNLNKHARVHSGQRPYPCEHCDKMFSSRGDLVRHAVIHTGEKPYACLICSLAFNRKDKLSRHERVHITDRPFACAECPTSFHRKEELTKHIRFHHFKPDPEYFNSLD